VHLADTVATVSRLRYRNFATVVTVALSMPAATAVVNDLCPDIAEGYDYGETSKTAPTTARFGMALEADRLLVLYLTGDSQTPTTA
jgi:hypothetical protein